MENIKKFYHCTKKDNMCKILTEGIKAGWDKVVYLTDTVNDSAKFLLVRGAGADDIVSFEIDVERLDKDKLDYSYDHSEDFFKCKAYIYAGDVPVRAITNVFEFRR